MDKECRKNLDLAGFFYELQTKLGVIVSMLTQLIYSGVGLCFSYVYLTKALS